MSKFFILAFIIYLSKVSEGVYVNNCPGIDAPIPENVIVPACTWAPCILRKGQSYKVEIDFKIDHNTNALKTIVSGIIAGLELPWNGVGPDGCSSIVVGSCPLKAWDYVTYAVELKVEDIYPTTPLSIKWQIRDDDNKPIFCFILPAEIQN